MNLLIQSLGWLKKAPIFVTAMGLKWVFLDFGDYQN
jgi:hypothetical protein